MTKELLSLSNEELAKWCANGQIPDNLVIIDIREPSEYRREHIPGSRNIPAAELAKTDFSADKDKTAIFHCRSGYRTKAAKDLILACGFKQTYCLPNGIAQWQQCHLPLVVDKGAPIEVMRQVQITAGSLVVIGVMLSYLLSPYFILLSAAVGAGLMYAGISGNCYMAILLAKMPWNRIK